MIYYIYAVYTINKHILRTKVTNFLAADSKNWNVSDNVVNNLRASGI